MNLATVLDAIRATHPDTDILFLCDRMNDGELNCRTQLADLVAREPVKLSDAILYETACWGIDDAASNIAEIRLCVRRLQ